MHIVEGSEVVFFKDATELEAVAIAIEQCSSDVYDEVGPYAGLDDGIVQVPAGCRVLMTKTPAPSINVRGSRNDSLSKLCKIKQSLAYDLSNLSSLLCQIHFLQVSTLQKTMVDPHQIPHSALGN